jgi:hypothetical protein
MAGFHTLFKKVIASNRIAEHEVWFRQADAEIILIVANCVAHDPMSAVRARTLQV